MLRIFSAMLVLWLCSLAGCGSDRDGPTAPVVYPGSKATFHGLWRGTLYGEATFESIALSEQDQSAKDMSCALEFNLFKYNLELENKPGGTETNYTQQGDWNWDSQDSGRLVFFEKSASLEQRWYLPGDAMQRSSVSSGEARTWSCRLEFSEDYQTLTLFEFDPGLALITLPDSAKLVFTRQE